MPAINAIQKPAAPMAGDEVSERQHITQRHAHTPERQQNNQHWHACIAVTAQCADRRHLQYIRHLKHRRQLQ